MSNILQVFETGIIIFSELEIIDQELKYYDADVAQLILIQNINLSFIYNFPGK
jgi:hypothetical protein